MSVHLFAGSVSRKVSLSVGSFAEYCSKLPMLVSGVSDSDCLREAMFLDIVFGYLFQISITPNFEGKRYRINPKEKYVRQ